MIAQSKTKSKLNQLKLMDERHAVHNIFKNDICGLVSSNNRILRIELHVLSFYIINHVTLNDMRNVVCKGFLIKAISETNKSMISSDQAKTQTYILSL